MWPFLNPTNEVVTSRLHGWCMVDVFVAGIHPYRTWTPGSFESVRWNACVHRLDLGLYSDPKEFWGNGVRSHANSKWKAPSTGSSEEDRTHDAASLSTASPPLYRLSYSGPTLFEDLEEAGHNGRGAKNPKSNLCTCCRFKNRNGPWFHSLRCPATVCLVQCCGCEAWWPDCCYVVKDVDR